MIGNFEGKNTLLRRGEFIGRFTQEFELPDFIFKEVIDNTEQVVPRHTHEDGHFLFIIDGLYITRAMKEDHLASPSTLIFNPSGTTHQDRFHTRGGRFFTVTCKTETLGCLGNSPGLIDRPVAFYGGEISWLGAKLYKEFQQRDELSPIVMSGLALELFGQTLRTHSKSSTSPPPWLKAAHELIQDRFNDPLTLTDIAQSVETHPVYLARAYRKYYRVTIGEFLRKLRVEFACKQMAGSDAPLSHVAVVAGFYDQSHFTRTFKRLTGMTPAEYRAISRRSAPQSILIAIDR